MGLLAMLAREARPPVPLKICCVRPCRSSPRQRCACNLATAAFGPSVTGDVRIRRMPQQPRQFGCRSRYRIRLLWPGKTRRRWWRNAGRLLLVHGRS
jgi:hypothetical protein